MLLSQVEIGKQYKLHDVGLKTATNEQIAPPHDLVVVITDKSQQVVHYKVLPDQYNPVGYSTDFSGTLSELGLQRLSEIE